MVDSLSSQADRFVDVLKSGLSKEIAGGYRPLTGAEDELITWSTHVSERISSHLAASSDSSESSLQLIQIGKASLQEFLQATVTGPPISWDPYSLFFPRSDSSTIQEDVQTVRHGLRTDLSIDGEAVYRLLPNVELISFSKIILNHPKLTTSDELIRCRLRVNTWHQRLLDFVSPSLQETIYRDVALLESRADANFILERALIHTLHGFDVKARDDLKSAAKMHGFDYVLTGRLGKRTKFQQHELSQLVVLAKSSESDLTSGIDKVNDLEAKKAPENLDLNDDTLLEKIAFSQSDDTKGSDAPGGLVAAESDIPESLANLNPSNQPLLQPLDSAILLALASSISSSSPHDGLTREGTAPYAERVLTGGSSNWQVYTQALLVRSRIEGYRSRTAERGLLQLQALVDQVIVETTSSHATGGNTGTGANDTKPTTFLPGLEDSESAPAAERLQYIHYLGSPPRWRLEAELADRWVTIGGLRTALEIYARLELWAEAALCCAASGRDEDAFDIVYTQLYEDDGVTLGSFMSIEDRSLPTSSEKTLLPNDAPRLFCILGDLTKSAAAYERAWEISKGRYARAQRSLGKIYLAKGENVKADEAYTKALKVNPQNHGSWFALGCVRLQLENWRAATEAFNRALQIEETDAESWSNLAVAMLELANNSTDPEEKAKHIKSSVLALKRAASLKRNSFRIWQNLLTVAIKLVPPPYSDIILAQNRLIDLLGASDGEKCIDVPIVEALLSDAIQQAPTLDSQAETEAPARGLEKMVIDLIQNKIEPLITTSRRLWQVVAKLALHQRHPLAALMSYEKAWRSQLNRHGWESATSAYAKTMWEAVVESTIDLIDAYESLGEKQREGGSEVEGELVAKDWKFKARSAARSVLAKGKEAWEDSEPYERLKDRLEELKSA